MLLKPRGRDLTPCVVKCNGIVLSVTNVSKNLGVWIDDGLTWKPHIEHLSCKCAQAPGHCAAMTYAWPYEQEKPGTFLWFYHPWCLPPTVFHPAWVRPCCLVRKKWPNQAFELFSVSNATLQLQFSDTVSMLSPFLRCIGRKLYLLNSGVLRAFQAHCFLHFLLSSQIISSIAASRGQVTRLLQVPFLHGPSGRKSIQFVGAILWNMLPQPARNIRNLLFKQFISTFDLTAVEII